MSKEQILISDLPLHIKEALMHELNRSDDNNTPVGAVLVSRKNLNIISTGTNYSIISKDLINWSKDVSKHMEQNRLEMTKYPYIVHAEQSCIMKYLQNKSIDAMTTKDLVLIITIQPCPECSRLIVLTGIKYVVYIQEYVSQISYNVATKKIFKENGVKMYNSWKEFKSESTKPE